MVDAFGDQNLEEIIREELDERDECRCIDFSASGEGIMLEVNSLDDNFYAELFESLFNPVSGSITDIPDHFDFILKKRIRFSAGWGTEYSETYSSELTGKEIQEIKRKSVEDSYAEGYSSERFRELYEGMR